MSAERQRRRGGRKRNYYDILLLRQQRIPGAAAAGAVRPQEEEEQEEEEEEVQEGKETVSLRLMDAAAAATELCVSVCATGTPAAGKKKKKRKKNDAQWPLWVVFPISAAASLSGLTGNFSERRPPSPHFSFFFWSTYIHFNECHILVPASSSPSAICQKRPRLRFCNAKIVSYLNKNNWISPRIRSIQSQSMSQNSLTCFDWVEPTEFVSSRYCFQ